MALERKAKKLAKQYFTYGLSSGTIAGVAGTTGSATLVFDNVFDWVEVQEIAGSARLTTPGALAINNTDLDYLYQIELSGQKVLSNIAVSAHDTLASKDRRRTITDPCLIVTKSQQIVVTFTNIHNLAVTCLMQFMGYQVTVLEWGQWDTESQRWAA